MEQWLSVSSKSIKESDLQKLFRNELSFLVIDDFLSLSEAHRWRQTLLKQGLQSYDYQFDHSDAPAAEHLMTTHYLFEENDDKEPYLRAAKQSLELWEEMVGYGNVDVLKRLYQGLRNAGFGVGPAREGALAYSSVIARQLNQGALLHADFAPFLKAEWSIRKVVSQLAWNVYIDVPETGGACVVYQRPWQISDDETFKTSTYGYDPSVVEGYDHDLLFPKLGQLVLFNSRNFHMVESCEGSRLTIGGHLAMLEDDELISWV